MNRWALMSGNVIAMIVVQHSKPELPGEWIDVTNLHVGPKYQFNNGVWVKPAI